MFEFQRNIRGPPSSTVPQEPKIEDNKYKFVAWEGDVMTLEGEQGQKLQVQVPTVSSQEIQFLTSSQTSLSESDLFGN